jgi:rare lipoprotein A (peptidoglycan hydrolase)
VIEAGRQATAQLRQERNNWVEQTAELHREYAASLDEAHAIARDASQDAARYRETAAAAEKDHEAHHAAIAYQRAPDTSGWRIGKATWYGPGFYGNKTACGQRYNTEIRGVAVPVVGGKMSIKCGTMVTVVYGDRSVRVPVIDSGGFAKYGVDLDLSYRTRMDLGAGDKVTIKWKVG